VELQQLNSSVQQTNDGRKKIKCSRVKRQELNEQETIDLRVFYWAAFYGKDKFVKIMIEELCWSPFIKSFRLRSIVSAAVLGNQVDTVRMMIGDYEYN